MTPCKGKEGHCKTKSWAGRCADLRNLSNEASELNDLDPKTQFFVEHAEEVYRYKSAAFDPWFQSLKTRVFSEKMFLTQTALSNLIAFKEYCMRYPGGLQYFNSINMHVKYGVVWSHYQKMNDALTDMKNHPEKYRKDEEIFHKEQAFNPYSLVDAIRECPGILQKDLYKQFDPDLKDHIAKVLYTLEQAGNISREKSGSSYRLYTK